MIFNSGNRKRLVVLGLDGLPLSLAQKLAPQLPSLGRLVESAVENTAEIPELSPVNWTSLYTGKGPEEHGVYGFTFIDPENYTLSIADFNKVKSETVFERLGQKGLVCKSINLPNTYPAHPLKGMMISGFVAEELEKAVYPPFLAGRLKEAGYLLEADTSRGIMEPHYLLDQVCATLECRMKALDMLWNDLAWDLFIFVLTETDRLFHFLYPAFEDARHPLHDPCMLFLKKWDAAIGRFLEKYDSLPGEKRLIVMADHGFTSLQTEVDLNVWLMQNGYLSLRHTPANQWDSTSISDTSRAFALDPGRICIHTHENYSRGCVAREEAPALAEEIREKLMNLTFNGIQVMEKILTGSELYGTAPVGEAPDLVCCAKPGYDLKAKFDRDEIFGFFGRTGTHTLQDAFFYDSQQENPGSVRDAGQMILNWFGI